MHLINMFDASAAGLTHNLRMAAGGFFTPVLRAVSLLGNGGAVFIAVAVFLLLFRRSRKTGILALIALLVGTILTDLLLKHIVARPRPFEDAASVFYGYWLEAGSLPASGYSFPSGHTTAAMSFAMALLLGGKKSVSWLSLLIPLVMGFSRVYFSVHYASDVAAGFLAGLIAGAAAWGVVVLLTRAQWFRSFLCARGLPEQLAERPRPS